MERKISLLYMLQSFGIGGKERMVIELANRLPRDEFDVHIVSRVGGLNLGLVDRTKVNVTVLTDTGWPYHAASVALLRKLRRGHFDIVHGHPGSICRISSMAAGVPIRVTTTHTLAEKSTARVVLERVLLRRTDRVIAVSQAARAYFAEQHRIDRRRIAVIYNGVDVEGLAEKVATAPRRDEMGLPEGDLVGVISRLHPDKGVSVLLRAAVEIAKHHPSARFVILGDGPERARLQRLTIDLGVGEKVAFMGFRNDVPHFLGHFKLIVHPTFRAGFEIVLVEAMAARLPIVATATGAIPEIVDDGRTGVLVPPGQPEPLAEAAIQLLGNREKSADMGDAGYRRAASRFSIARSVEAHRRLYWELADLRLNARRYAVTRAVA